MRNRFLEESLVALLPYDKRHERNSSADCKRRSLGAVPAPSPYSPFPCIYSALWVAGKALSYALSFFARL